MDECLGFTSKDDWILEDSEINNAVGDVIVRQSPRLAARSIDGKGVLIVLDRQVVHTLNGVGMRVFELADRRSVAEIGERLTEEFDVSSEQALADAGTFVAKLLALGALEEWVEP